MSSIEGVSAKKVFISGIRTASNDKQKEDKNYPVRYMTGDTGMSFRKLCERRILNEKAEFIANVNSHTLPPLNQEELSILRKEFLNRYALILASQNKIIYSLKDLIFPFFDPKFLNANKWIVSEATLTGSYFRCFLMTKTDYAKRVCKMIDPYSSYENLGSCHQDSSQLEINLVIQQSNPPRNKERASKLLKEKLIAAMARHLAELWKTDRHQPLDHYIVQQLTEYLYANTTSNPQEHTFTVDFKGFPFRINFCFHRRSLAAFSWNALYLPLRNFFSSDFTALPRFETGSQLDNFYQLALGFFNISDYKKFTWEHYFEYLKLIAKGGISADSTYSIKDILFKSLNGWCAGTKEEVAQKLMRFFDKFLSQNFYSDPVGGYLFVFMSLCHLSSLVDQEEAYFILKRYENTKLNSPFLIRFLNLVNRIPLKTVMSLLQLVGYLGSPFFELEMRDFKDPFLGCIFQGKKIGLDLKPDKAIAHLLYFQREFSKVWSEAEEEIKDFFFFLRPLEFQNAVISETLMAAMTQSEVTFSGIENSIHNSLNSSSTFLKYLGVTLALCHPNFNPGQRLEIAQKYYPQLLEFIPQRESLREQLESSIGKDSLLPPETENFFEKWLVTLFQQDGAAQIKAYNQWKEGFETGKISVVSSLNLVVQLAHRQTDYGTNILFHLRNQHTLTEFPADSLACIFHSLAICRASQALHHNFVGELGKSLLVLLEAGHLQEDMIAVEKEAICWCVDQLEAFLFQEGIILRERLFSYHAKEEVDSLQEVAKSIPSAHENEEEPTILFPLQVQERAQPCSPISLISESYATQDKGPPPLIENADALPATPNFESIENPLELLDFLMNCSFKKQKINDRMILTLLNKTKNIKIKLLRNKLQSVFSRFFVRLSDGVQRDVIRFCAERCLVIGESNSGNLWLAALNKWFQGNKKSHGEIAKIFEKSFAKYSYSQKGLIAFLTSFANSTLDKTFRLNLIMKVIEHYPPLLEEKAILALLIKSLADLNNSLQKMTFISQLSHINIRMASLFCDHAIHDLERVLKEKGFAACHDLLDAADFLDHSEQSALLDQFMVKSFIPACVQNLRKSGKPLASEKVAKRMACIIERQKEYFIDYFYIWQLFCTFEGESYVASADRIYIGQIAKNASGENWKWIFGIFQIFLKNEQKERVLELARYLNLPTEKNNLFELVKFLLENLKDSIEIDQGLKKIFDSAIPALTSQFNDLNEYFDLLKLFSLQRIDLLESASNSILPVLLELEEKNEVQKINIYSALFNLLNELVADLKNHPHQAILINYVKDKIRFIYAHFADCVDKEKMNALIKAISITK